MVSLVALLCLVKASGSINHTGWQWRGKRRAPGRRYSFTSKGRAGQQAPSTSCSGGRRGLSPLLVTSLRVVSAWDWCSLVRHHFFILFVVPMNALCIFCAEALFLSHHVHCACAQVISFFNMRNDYDGARPVNFFNLYLSISCLTVSCWMYITKQIEICWCWQMLVRYLFECLVIFSCCFVSADFVTKIEVFIPREYVLIFFYPEMYIK